MGRFADKVWAAIDGIIGSDNAWDAYGPPILPERPTLPPVRYTNLIQTFDLPAGSPELTNWFDITFVPEQAQVSYTVNRVRSYATVYITGRPNAQGIRYENAEYTVFAPFTDERLSEIPAVYLPLVRAVMNKIEED